MLTQWGTEEQKKRFLHQQNGSIIWHTFGAYDHD
jgi:hypothetical protein